MKKSIILFSLLVASISLVAQDGVAKYYAVDGSTWSTKYDRDKKESLLWQKIELNLRAALVADRLGVGVEGKENYETFQNLFSLCQQSFETVRLADMGKEVLQNAEFRFFLSQNGVKARTGVARNGEPFNMEEYASCFDAVLREYSFNADIVAKLADVDGEVYNLQFVVTDFSERMELVQDKIEREKLAMDLKVATIKTLIPKYKARKQEELKSQRKQNRRKD